MSKVKEFNKLVRQHNKLAKEINSEKRARSMQKMMDEGRMAIMGYEPKRHVEKDLEPMNAELAAIKAKMDAVESEAEAEQKAQVILLTPEEQAAHREREIKRILRNPTYGPI